MKQILFFLFFVNSLLYSKTIEMVVGFSQGGATYEMAKVVTKYLEKELNQDIKILIKEGEGSLYAANYVLEEDENKIKIFASTFSPYLANTIISKQANYSISDFTMINLQWFDYDIFLVNKSSKYNSLLKLLDDVKSSKTQLRLGVNYRSSAHSLIDELIKKYEIPKRNIKKYYFYGGKKTRDAILENKIDLAILPAQGSEISREKLKALAIANKKRVKRWDTPTLSELLKQRDISISYKYASIRGFAFSSKFKKNNTLEYKRITKAFRKILAKKNLQKELKRKQISYIYLGEKKSNEIIKDVYEDLNIKNNTKN